MYERCLEGVWKASGGFLEGVWRVSGGCLECVSMVSGRFLDPKFVRFLEGV